MYQVTPGRTVHRLGSLPKAYPSSTLGAIPCCMRSPAPTLALPYVVPYANVVPTLAHEKSRRVQGTFCASGGSAGAAAGGGGAAFTAVAGTATGSVWAPTADAGCVSDDCARAAPARAATSAATPIFVVRRVTGMRAPSGRTATLPQEAGGRHWPLVQRPRMTLFTALPAPHPTRRTTRSRWRRTALRGRVRTPRARRRAASVRRGSGRSRDVCESGREARRV